MSADAVGEFLSTIALRPLSNYSELGFRIANFTRALENQLSDYNKDNKDRKSTRLNSSHSAKSRMPSSA